MLDSSNLFIIDCDNNEKFRKKEFVINTINEIFYNRNKLNFATTSCIFSFSRFLGDIKLIFNATNTLYTLPESFWRETLYYIRNISHELGIPCAIEINIKPEEISGDLLYILKANNVFLNIKYEGIYKKELYNSFPESFIKKINSLNIKYIITMVISDKNIDNFKKNLQHIQNLSCIKEFSIEVSLNRSFSGVDFFEKVIKVYLNLLKYPGTLSENSIDQKLEFMFDFLRGNNPFGAADIFMAYDGKINQENFFVETFKNETNTPLDLLKCMKINNDNIIKNHCDFCPSKIICDSGCFLSESHDKLSEESLQFICECSKSMRDFLLDNYSYIFKDFLLHKIAKSNEKEYRIILGENEGPTTSGKDIKEGFLKKLLRSPSFEIIPDFEDKDYAVVDINNRSKTYSIYIRKIGE